MDMTTRIAVTISLKLNQDVEEHFNQIVDVIYGSICCLCFLIGTTGNIVSFLYFNSKKRDMSSVIYMQITANDVLVSLTVLPVGFVYLSERSAGIVFGTSVGCETWSYLWETVVAQSNFMVMCLSITRTVSLISPFTRQKLSHVIIAPIIFLVLRLATIVAVHFIDQGMEARYYPRFARCDFYLNETLINEAIHHSLLVSTNLVYTAPAFVVGISCVISAVLLTRTSEHVHQRQLQKTRNRATVTILLFGLLYVVCNVPLVVNYILQTYALNTNNKQWYFTLYQFDTHMYFNNAMRTLLLAANSAANPLLYLWRMPPLRGYIGRILELRRQRRRGPNYVLEGRSNSNVVHNNNVESAF